MDHCSTTIAGLPVSDREKHAETCWWRCKQDFPIEWDWVLQDEGGQKFWRCLLGDTARTERIAAKAVSEAGNPADLGQKLDELRQTNPPPPLKAWLMLYEAASVQRRAQRLQTVLKTAPRIVFTKRRTLRPSFFAYTEGQSDAQHERHFLPGAELCLLDLNSSLQGEIQTLVSDRTGAIRDPAVSWDGERVLFAWKKSLDNDDYHLYELDVRSGNVKQITLGDGFADYEPAYLPNDDVVFSSTRCVQTVDCWWTEVSNLYVCGPDGRHLRRLSFDQVHAIYPQVLDDGRILYTRWDYNDRGQIFPQPLFQMLPDGTGQTEFYGNNSWFPTTIAHARGIPGTEKVIAILCGHHTAQAGKLAVIDPAKGRQENSGVQLVAPTRATRAERIDGYGQEGELWQYPFALNERECLVTYAPLGWDQPKNRPGDADFGIYWMDMDGRRELLAWDAKYPCSQPVPLTARPKPAVWPSRVDYGKSNGVYYLQDVYAGPGLAGIPRGIIKKLRVVALRFRPAGVGNNGSAGPGGGALISTPVSIGNGTWDVKEILGDATVHADGSALFSVPARTPVYFQALDENGYAVQTMRSWSTLQPGEVSGCVGCHEHKNTAPPATNYDLASMAARAGPQQLELFYGPSRGFSFVKEVQPVLDRHCIQCHRERSPVQSLSHNAETAPILAAASAPATDSAEKLAFSLLGSPVLDRTAKRNWTDSYLVLTQVKQDRNYESVGAFIGDNNGRIVRWIGSQSVPEPIPPYFSGAARSPLMTMLRKGHHEVKLSREELEKLAAWIDLLVPFCGDYTEANAWSEEEMNKFAHFAAKRKRMEDLEKENLQSYLQQQRLE